MGQINESYLSPWYVNQSYAVNNNTHARLIWSHQSLRIDMKLLECRYVCVWQEYVSSVNLEDMIILDMPIWGEWRITITHTLLRLPYSDVPDICLGLIVAGLLSCNEKAIIHKKINLKMSLEQYQKLKTKNSIIIITKHIGIEWHINIKKRDVCERRHCTA